MNLKEHLQKLKTILDKNTLEAAYISSSDQYLNEYVPLENSQRYFLTGFTGSTSELLITNNLEVYLFVDGRYHQQADLEVDKNVVTVVKCPLNLSIQTAMLDKIAELKIKSLAVDGQRTSFCLIKKIEKLIKVTKFNHFELDKILPIKKYKFVKNITQLPIEVTGESSISKVQRLIRDTEACFLSSLDSIAWVTNCRGFHLPFQSTFLAKALVQKTGITVFIDTALECEIYVLDKFIDFRRIDFSHLKEELAKVVESNIERIYYDDLYINGSDYSSLMEIFSNKLVEKSGGIIDIQSIKNQCEIAEMKQSFNKSSKVIFETLTFIKEAIASGKKISEGDVFQKVNDLYRKSGALDQSFNTIAAVGPNSSIIHYSKSDPTIEISETDFVLLDSGALYQNGYATDTTRTILAGKNPSAKQKEIYSLVLKGLLNALNAVFPADTWGAAIDMLARLPLCQYGLNFNHSTGHGVGINVHEGGIRFNSKSSTPIKIGQVVSIEPGIYIPDFGGVRLEDVVVVKAHDRFSEMLCFESLVYIGFDHSLIDQQMLNVQELKYLEVYESECKRRGTLLT